METTRPTILVVDADRELCSVLGVVLGEVGDVHTVNDAARADAWVARHGVPDVAVIDLLMPGTTDEVLIREWRADRDTCDVPVIVLSTRSRGHEVLAGFRAGTESYLAKPFDPDLLTVVVSQLLAHREEVREQAAATLSALA